MRILQVITLCDLGGAQSVVVNLANSLVKEHEVIVAAELVTENVVVTSSVCDM